MVKIHSLGFPRIGAKRELKTALEALWQGELSQKAFESQTNALYLKNLQQQENLDYQPVGDFSAYDHVLDHSVMFGNIPARFTSQNMSALQQYFCIARGQVFGETAQQNQAYCAAGEMTKWYDTNYHYIVPEFTQGTEFKLDATSLLKQIHVARAQGFNVKPVVLGPISYLLLGKSKDDIKCIELLEPLLVVYAELLELISRCSVEWIQIDEPALVTDLAPQWQSAYVIAYQKLSQCRSKLLLSTYFDDLGDNLQLACALPVDGLHIDAVRGAHQVQKVHNTLALNKVLSIGAIDGRNVWKTDLNAVLDLVEPIAQAREHVWLAPSCSLMHVPVNLNSEETLDEEIKSWLSFAVQKLEELEILREALNRGRESVAKALQDNAEALFQRRNSARVHNQHVQKSVSEIRKKDYERQSSFDARISIQGEHIKLPLFPTTTIGSFPQTPHIRKLRQDFKRGNIDEQAYQRLIKLEIKACIDKQEALGLDVLVHGEPERNDMVEYFGEQLEGFVFTTFAWVQSYGSRCVKPPIIYGDVSRPNNMTVDWIRYAQSLTKKPVKGMLTGPVTILNWSFVRDDQARSETCKQIALAIRQEVLELERVGTQLIQIDEAALREGLPLKKSRWQDYLRWAVDCFRLSANGVMDKTQIHTHMCYSEFNDILQEIAALDADVISIETSRSDMELLEAFSEFNYPNDIGPGVYDIHSPSIPSVDAMQKLLKEAATKVSEKRLWVNPDCGLKTRHWDEVMPALDNMVKAAKGLRAKHKNIGACM